MKIGVVSKRVRMSPSAIRFYIKQGLIFPEKINNQYNFSEKEIKLLNLINMWKEMGFSLKEIIHLSALKQESNWIEVEDFSYYHNIIENRKNELENELSETKRRLNLVKEELLNLQNNEFYRHKLRVTAYQPFGIPLSCLNLLVCPICGQPLQLQEAQLDYKFVYNGILSCSCNYHAVINQGIIHCGQFSNHILESPDISLSKNKKTSNELSTILQRASNWMLSASYFQFKPQVIMETRLNAYFFLYPRLKEICPGSTIIISDAFTDTVSLYKQYIEKLNLALNLICIVNEDNQLPIKHSSVDTFIDFGSSNNYNLYESTPYLPQFFPFLQNGGQIIGTFFSLEQAKKSISVLHNMFPRCQTDNYNFSYFKKSLKEYFDVIDIKNLGFVRDIGSSNMFPFFQIGEKLGIQSFALKKCKLGNIQT